MWIKRLNSAERLVRAHSELLSTRLEQPGASPQAQLLDAHAAPGTVLLLRWNSNWFTTGPDHVRDAVQTPDLAGPSVAHTTRVWIESQPYMRVGTRMNDRGDVLYEFTPITELEATLRVLRNLLIACAAAAASVGVALGAWAGRRVLNPLRQVAAAAARISSGDLDLRLPATRDRDLVTTVNSFNTMVDSLQQRIDRERRLVGDVSHELRTPLTTLITSVGVMQHHEQDLPQRARQALNLIAAEVEHLHHMLEDMLELARVEAGVQRGDTDTLALHELLRHTLGGRNYPQELLRVIRDARVRGRKLELERAVANLLDNASRHGGGPVAVVVDAVGSWATIAVEDAGPGVPQADRDRIFERFATIRAERRSATGTGIGLALVRETVRAHGGRVEYADRPGGGARLVLWLPLASSAEDDG